MPQNADLIKALQVISEGIQEAKIPLADRLWTAADIAAYVQLSEYTVNQKVISQPGFPVPVALASRRWFAGEVVEWAKKNRAKTPKGRLKRQE